MSTKFVFIPKTHRENKNKPQQVRLKLNGTTDAQLITPIKSSTSKSTTKDRL